MSKKQWARWSVPTAGLLSIIGCTATSPAGPETVDCSGPSSCWAMCELQAEDRCGKAGYQVLGSTAVVGEAVCPTGKVEHTQRTMRVQCK